MAFCRNCGAQLGAEDKFCSSCGTPVAAPKPPQAEAPVYEDQQAEAPVCENPQAAGETAQPQQPSFQQPEQQTAYQANIAVAPQPRKSADDHTADYDPQDISRNNIFAVLSYLSWLVLIPLLAAKDSKFARFHANQGLVLAIGGTALGIIRAIVVAILRTIIYAISYRLSFIITLVSVVFTLLGIGLGVLSIIGIVYAASGKAKELPLVGKIRILK